MGRTAKLSRQALILQLQALVEQGRALSAGPVEDEAALAELAVARLEWAHAATGVVQQLPRNSVGTFSDFNRAGGAGQWLLLPGPAEEAVHLRGLIAAQAAVLEQARVRLEKHRTRPLTESL